MSVRLRILTGLVGLLVAGLAAFSLGIRALLNDYLVGQVNQQLVSLTGTLRTVAQAETPRGQRPVLPDPGLRVSWGRRADQIYPKGVVVELRDGTGTVVDRTSTLPVKDRAPRFPVAPATGMRTIGTGAATYRLLTTKMDIGGRAYTLLVALPLLPVHQILGTLDDIEIVLGLIVAAIGAGLVLAVARIVTRPLGRIASTADAIAAGDLSLRVPDADRRTEVGRVGLAFNAMLTEIETTVGKLTESEGRMRAFLADASHELSTPLTSIRGYAELFRSGARSRPADLEIAMDRIEREAARMGELVDDLLLLAALDEGRPVRRDLVDLTAIAADAVDDARMLAPERRVELEVAGPVRLNGDEGRLRQVAANLVSNALRHTPGGTPVTVRTHANDDVAVFEVADKGLGLGAAQAARVFERFFRTDPARSRERGGNGLGLSIVAAIAAAHGGRASVDTSPGEGATFRVELPRSL